MKNLQSTQKLDFQGVLNSEFKYLVESIEHGTSDPEVDYNLRVTLFKATGYSYENILSDGDEKFVSKMMKKYSIAGAKKAIDNTVDEIRFTRKKGNDTSISEDFLKLWYEVYFRLQTTSNL